MTKLLALLVLVLVTGCSGKKDEPQPTAAPAQPAAAAPQPAPPLPPPSIDAAPANPRPPGIEDEQVEAADAVGAWFTTLASAARGAGMDCASMATALRSSGTKGRPLVSKAKGAAKKLKDRAAAAWLADYTSTTMQNGFAELMEAVGPCQVNPAVKAAMKTLAK
jgi:hypothetical protein